MTGMLAALLAALLETQPMMMGCHAETIAGFSPEPKGQCVRSYVIMLPETRGCSADLEAMGRQSAQRFERLARPNPEFYAGHFDGFVLKETGKPKDAGCATSCIKLPKGTQLVELRGVVSEGGRNVHPGRRTYSAGAFDADAGKPYIIEQRTAQTPIGPVVCARVGNARPEEDKWNFALYAYFEQAAK